MCLKEELKVINKKMYQNMEKESLLWMENHFQEIKTSMIEAWSTKYQGDAQAKEILMTILASLFDAYNRQDMLAMGDILRYEVIEYI